jgi:aminoglycoside N3'-acetyltransferase
MDLISDILGWSPYLEVVVRRIYWNSPKLVELASSRSARRARPPAPVGEHTFAAIEAFLRESGIGAGDLIVVHSSAEALKPTGLGPSKIVDRMLALAGPSGTVAMPAFPRYDGEPQGVARMTADVSGLLLEYDMKRSIPWTGAVPLKLMQRPGSVRSAHPLNTMVARGPLAQAMMEKNLEGDRPLPCGPNSSWKFCLDHGAKIIALGVDMAHSLTMIHVAEDCHEDKWPVSGWYRERKFVVVDGAARKEVLVRERHPRWAMHYAERTLARDLVKRGIMRRATIDGIRVEVLEAKALINFLDSRNASGYPYYMLPARRDR